MRAEIGEREVEAFRKLHGFPHRFRNVRKQNAHGAWRFEMPFGVAGEQPARVHDRGFVMDRGERIE